MKRHFGAIAWAAFSIIAPQANAAIITFDDIPTREFSGERPYFYAQVPSQYGGISWDAQWYVYGTSQYPYTPASSPNRLASNNLSEGVGFVSFSFLSPALFGGMYFSGTDVSVPIYYNMYWRGSLVGQTQVGSPTATPTFAAASYSGPIDRVSIFGSRGFYVIDDVSYETAVLPPTAPAVPEPGTWAMMLIGIGSTATAMRRRRKRQPMRLNSF